MDSPCISMHRTSSQNTDSLFRNPFLDVRQDGLGDLFISVRRVDTILSEARALLEDARYTMCEIQYIGRDRLPSNTTLAKGCTQTNTVHVDTPLIHAVGREKLI